MNDSQVLSENNVVYKVVRLRQSESDGRVLRTSVVMAETTAEVVYNLGLLTRGAQGTPVLAFSDYSAARRFAQTELERSRYNSAAGEIWRCVATGEYLVNSVLPIDLLRSQDRWSPANPLLRVLENWWCDSDSSGMYTVPAPTNTVACDGITLLALVATVNRGVVQETNEVRFNPH